MINRSIEMIGKPTDTLLKEAIKNGKKEEALELVDEMMNERKRLHSIKLISLAATYLAEKYGEEEVSKLWRFIYDRFYKEVTENRFKIGALQTLQELGAAHRTLGSEFEVSEDNEKYIINLKLCGSGGRLRKSGAMEKYGIWKTVKSRPESWNRTGVSIYCTHCCSSLQLLPFEKYGKNVIAYEYSKEDDGTCKTYVYKDPDLYPDKHKLTR